MDRDSRENVLDPVERVSPSTGDNDTGESGDQEARVYRERKRGAGTKTRQKDAGR
jgi:hypothetical protein